MEPYERPVVEPDSPQPAAGVVVVAVGVAVLAVYGAVVTTGGAAVALVLEAAGGVHAGVTVAK